MIKPLIEIVVFALAMVAGLATGLFIAAIQDRIRERRGSESGRD